MLNLRFFFRVFAFWFCILLIAFLIYFGYTGGRLHAEMYDATTDPDLQKGRIIIGEESTTTTIPEDEDRDKDHTFKVPGYDRQHESDESKVCYHYNTETKILETEPCKPLSEDEITKFNTPPPDSKYKCYYRIVRRYDPKTNTEIETKEPCQEGGIVEEPPLEGEKP